MQGKKPEVIYEKSKAEILASLSEHKQATFLRQYTPAQLEELQKSWDFWARPKQMLPPGDWFCWLILSGRGFGKTRTGAETIRQWIKEGYKHIALVGQTKSDVRDTMLLGESGLLTICREDDDVPEYIASRRVVIWPKSGARATLYSGDEPDQLRGPQHEKAWVDELVKFQKAEDCWDNLELGLRLGDKPQVIVTTTPKPQKIMKDLRDDPASFVTRGSSYENSANLADRFIDRIIKKYEGTNLGKQELYGEILDNYEGALWGRAVLETTRVECAPPLKRIVVAIDPAVTMRETSDDTGIVVCGLGRDNHGYILEDCTVKDKAIEWAKLAVTKYNDYNADKIVGEVNNGGDLVETVIRFVEPNANFGAVWASKGKYTRAEPVAALYEQFKVHHVGDPSNFEFLEVEMCEWLPAESKKSPNRIDALVWGISELMLEKDRKGKITPLNVNFRRAVG